MMQHAGKPPWKFAATLLIAARSKPVPNAPKPTFDYKLLLMARSATSSFMPNQYVFPGGGVSKGDFSPKWSELFQKSGYDIAEIGGELRCKNPAEIVDSENYTDYMSSSSITADIALRICAVRESFEESGILVARRCSHGSSLFFNSKQDGGESERNEWRKKVYENDSSFVDLCEKLNAVPNIWSLSEWSNWLTPVSSPGGGKAKKRFNAIFYICTLDEYAEDMYVLEDNKEMVKSRWLSPEDALRSSLTGEVNIAPPQMYELMRLANFTTFSQLENFHRKRAKEGLELLFPVRYAADDGVIMTLPGDDLYPEEPDYILPREPITIKGSMADQSDRSTSQHRIQFFKDGRRLLNCSVKPRFGHVAPVDFSDIIKVSKL